MCVLGKCGTNDARYVMILYHHISCVAVCCSVSQCVAVCYSVLQCVAVCCSVLQCDVYECVHTHRCDI